jgi:hypothetical protein
MRSTRVWIAAAALIGGLACVAVVIPPSAAEDQAGPSKLSSDATGRADTDGNASQTDAEPVVVRPREGLPLDVSEDEVKRRGELLAAIKRPVSIDCQDLPLAKVIREITEGLPIRVKFDEKAISDDGTVSLDDPVTLLTENEPVESILFDLLSPRGLTWLLRSDSLVITSKSEADANLETVAYDVTDLVVDSKTGQADMRMLVELLYFTVHPDSWVTVGGAGGVFPFAREKSALLVVRQQSDVHKNIDHFLAGLRKTAVVTEMSSSLPRITLVPLPVKLLEPQGEVSGSMCPGSLDFLSAPKSPKPSTPAAQSDAVPPK